MCPNALPFGGQNAEVFEIAEKTPLRPAVADYGGIIVAEKVTLCFNRKTQLHRSILSDKETRSATMSPGASQTSVVREQITITRDERSNEWVVELGPRLDLLEVVQVLNQVQHQVIEMMQEQMVNAALSKSPVSDNVDQSLRDTVTF